MDNTHKNISAPSPTPENNAEKEKDGYTLAHGIFALLTFVLGTLWYRWMFVYDRGEYRAVSMTVFAVVFTLFTLSFFKIRRISVGKDGYVFLAAMLVYSVRFVIYPDDTWSFISLLTQIVLHITALLYIYSAGIGKSSDNIVGSILNSVFTAPFSCFFAIFTSMSAFLVPFTKKDPSRAKLKKLLSETGLVLLGLLIAFPVIVYVFALLDSDGFFSGLTDKILEYLGNISFDMNIGNYVNIISILVSMYICGAMFCAEKKSREVPAVHESYSIVPETVGKTVMVSLIAVYILFFIAQIDGFSHMISGTLPAFTTYAEFARSGFFELCIVACINGATLYFHELLTIKKEPIKRPGITKILLICFTLFLILTAAVKMVMYICAYGFTPKRFYTLWFMVLLTVLFIMAIFKLGKESFRFSRYSVYVTLVWLAVLLLVDFESISLYLNNWRNI